MYQSINVDHLPVISTTVEVTGFNYAPDIIWIFDLDRHGFWWGNQRALEFWGLENVEQLINKDLSDDTEGARKRTEQTFVKAAIEGQTQDPWTTYPNGKPKLMLMRHVAVLLGEEKHRGIIAFISEQLDNNVQPENLLFAEAVRYTSAMVSCYDLTGKRLFENPAFTLCYDTATSTQPVSDFVMRFCDTAQGEQRLKQAQQQQDCQHEHLMQTKQGLKRHNVDVRSSRHPITGDYVFLVTEYDITELHDTITELKQTKAALKQLAHYDPLTSLPTVWLSRERVQNALVKAKRDKTIVAVMFIDLDGFKQVNDNYGHATGDKLLTLVGKRLASIFRESDTVGRIGGDEFLVCLPELSTKNNAYNLAEKTIEELSREFDLFEDKGRKQHANISASIGIAFYPDEGRDVDSLIKVADKKMYQAKNSGKNKFVV